VAVVTTFSFVPLVKVQLCLLLVTCHAEGLIPIERASSSSIDHRQCVIGIPELRLLFAVGTDSFVALEQGLAYHLDITLLYPELLHRRTRALR